MEFEVRTARPSTGRPPTAGVDARHATSSSALIHTPNLHPTHAGADLRPLRPHVPDGAGVSSTLRATPEDWSSVAASSSSLLREMAAPPQRAIPDNAADPGPSSQLSRSQTTPFPHFDISQRSTHRRDTDLGHGLPSTSNYFPPAAYGQVLDNVQMDHQVTADQGARSSDRPTTGSSYSFSSLRLPDTLEHEIPPRRELPFKRPLGMRGSSSRPGTAAKETQKPLLGKPRPSTGLPNQTTAASLRQIEPRPNTAAPLKRDLAAGEFDSNPYKRLMATSTQMAALEPPTSGSRTQDAGPSIQKPTSMYHTARSAQTSLQASSSSHTLGRSDPTFGTNIQRLGSLADAQYEDETPPQTAVASAGAQEPGKATATSVTSVYNALHTAVEGSISLSEFAGQSREDRMAQLEEFMMAKLLDPAFEVLCGDMDACWRRISLGM